MAFTDPPRTWVDGETETASVFNAHVRDQFNSLKQRAISWSYGDPGGALPTVGVKGYMEIPLACTITGWTIISDQTGSIQIDIWKTTYAGAPPTVANTITGSQKPLLSAAQKNQNLGPLGSWTTAVSLGDILAWNIDSVTTIKQVSVSLRCVAA